MANVIIIRTSPKKKAKRIPEPQQHLWKTMKEHEYKAYVASMDWLDKSCTRGEA